MRNYIRAPSATMQGNDGVNDHTLVFFGQTQEGALAAANATAQQLISGGWTSAFAFQNPDIYVLLNQALVQNLLVLPEQGSQPAGGELGFNLWNVLRSISEQQGLDPFVSPKLQKVYPWNGRAKRTIESIERARGGK
jgi:hypothetical protein